MTEPERDDPSFFDLGGLPGGDILFTDPLATSYAEQSPTAAVPPEGGTTYRPEGPTTYRPDATPAPAAPPRAQPANAPKPPARWPRPGDAVKPRRGLAASPRTRPAPASTTTSQTRVTPSPRPPSSARPGPPRPGPVRRRKSKGRAAWPLILILFWGGPAVIRSITHTDFGLGSSGSSSGSSSSEISPPADGAFVDTTDMTTLSPHSIDPNSAYVTIHIDAPPVGTYSITGNGIPGASDVTAAYEYEVTGTVTPDGLLVAATDPNATIRCEIRDIHGEVVATGEATGTLDCAYDPTELLE